MCPPTDHGNDQDKYNVRLLAGKWKKRAFDYNHGPDPEGKTRVFKVEFKASSPDVMVRWKRFGAGNKLVGTGSFSKTLDFVLYPKDKNVAFDLFCKEAVKVVARRMT